MTAEAVHLEKPGGYALQLPVRGLLLYADKVRVDAGLCDELFMPALLHNAAMVDDQDLIGVAHGFEAMGDHDTMIKFVISHQRR